jgi:hypothetical protein
MALMFSSMATFPCFISLEPNLTIAVVSFIPLRAQEDERKNWGKL